MLKSTATSSWTWWVQMIYDGRPFFFTGKLFFNANTFADRTRTVPTLASWKCSSSLRAQCLSHHQRKVVSVRRRRGRQWNAAPLFTYPRTLQSTCTSVLAPLPVRSSRRCWRSSQWWIILASLLCLSAASAMTRVLLTFLLVHFANLMFLRILHVESSLALLAAVYIRKLSDNERPLRLRLASGPNEKVLSFVLKENETGEVNVSVTWVCKKGIPDYVFCFIFSFVFVFLFPQWHAFSMPELKNFLRILQREEEEHIKQIVQRYALARTKMQEVLAGSTPGWGESVTGIQSCAPWLDADPNQPSLHRWSRRAWPRTPLQWKREWARAQDN